MLAEFLKNEGFIISEETARLIESVLHLHQPKAFLLRGPPGSGKTHLTSLVARFIKAEYIFFQCTSGTNEDDLLYRYVPSESTKSGIKITLGPLPRALIQSQKRTVALVLDEFDKTRPGADALLLDFLQNCRLSLYIDDELTVVKGNPQNLVVFLTSNDFREFSEPLIRRLTVVTLQPPKPEKVYQILSSRYGEDVAMLLTQVYEDTINAGCRKPATIPELVSLAEVMTKNPDLDFEKLLRSMILKYDDDWGRYVDYVRSRKPFQFSQLNSAEESIANIAKFYEPEQEQPALIYTEEPEQKGATVGEVLQNLQKLKVPTRFEEVHAEQVTEEREVFMILEDKDKEAYTAVVKNLRPTPGNRPDEFGKFKVYFEDDKVFVTSNAPLTVAELKKLMNVRGEFYAESVYRYVDFKRIFDFLVNGCSKVEYYTTHKVRVSLQKGQQTKDIVVVEAEKLRSFPPTPYGDVMLRYYVNGQPSMIIEPKDYRPVKLSDSEWSMQRVKQLAQMIYEFAKHIPISLKIVSLDYYTLMGYSLDDEEAPTKIDIKMGKDLVDSLRAKGVDVNITEDKEAVLKILEEVMKL